jgi:hypothetical protein
MLAMLFIAEQRVAHQQTGVADAMGYGRLVSVAQDVRSPDLVVENVEPEPRLSAAFFAPVPEPVG